MSSDGAAENIYHHVIPWWTFVTVDLSQQAQHSSSTLSTTVSRSLAHTHIHLGCRTGSWKAVNVLGVQVVSCRGRWEVQLRMSMVFVEG